jgi:DNA-directed RNA polymerase subunit N (RpoN/RPB10)
MDPPRFTGVAPVKQPAELTCFTCGAFIGQDRELVRTFISSLRAEFARERDVRPEYVAGVPGCSPDIGDLLDALGYCRSCCRTHLMTEYPHAGIHEPPKK